MKRLLALFLLLCLTACDGEFKMRDVAGQWHLLSMDGKALNADTLVSLDIQEDGKFAGKAPVNRYFGQIKIEGKTIKTGPVGSTMMAGEPEQMQLEQEYFKALGEQVKSAKVENDQLVITSMDDTQLVYQRSK